ncbi:ZIP family metal transporter [Brevibacillus fulvus]|uniref:ZIP family metal transporter n=1 Tax=Brevibacillus fulvus TaxID=1125967 RepID=UPI0030845DE0
MQLLPSTFFLLVCASALASVLGGMIIFLRRAWSDYALEAMVSAGGGILLSLTILDMIPHAAHEPRLIPFVLVGFSLLFVIELAGKEATHPANKRSVSGVYLGFLIHAFVEGVSLMASFQVNAHLGYSLIIALLLHKIPDGVTVATLLYASNKNRCFAFLGAVTLGGTTLLGILSVYWLDQWLPAIWSEIVISITTGVFLFVAASHLVPHILQKQRQQLGFYFFAGMLGYMLFSLLVQKNLLHPA